MTCYRTESASSSDAELRAPSLPFRQLELQSRVLGKNMPTDEGFLSIMTMQLAMGMELRDVAMMACDEEVVPFQSSQSVDVHPELIHLQG